MYNDTRHVRTYTVRGVPVVAEGHSIHAIAFGPFPISPTGFRYCFDPHLPLSAEALEEMALEADNECSEAIKCLQHSVRRHSGRSIGAMERLHLDGAVEQVFRRTVLASRDVLPTLLACLASAGPLYEALATHASPTSSTAALAETISFARLCENSHRLAEALLRLPYERDPWRQFLTETPFGPQHLPRVARSFIDGTGAQIDGSYLIPLAGLIPLLG